MALTQSNRRSMAAERTTGQRLRRIGRSLPIYLALLPLVLATLVPIVYMYSLAFTPESATTNWPIRLIPEQPTLDNFRRLLRDPGLPIARWLFNSVFVSVATTALVLFIDSLTAYAFARLEFPGRDALFIATLTTIMIPGQVTLVPTFLLMRNLGWLDSYHALIWPAGAQVFGIFLLRQLFQSIPRDLEEAAIIDGASKFDVYRRIILPLGTSGLVTLAILTFLGSWNDLFWPLIVLNATEMRTLPVGLTILSGENYTQRGLTMAAAALTSFPVFVLYAVFQRRIMQGVMLSGLAGR